MRRSINGRFGTNSAGFVATDYVNTLVNAINIGTSQKTGGAQVRTQATLSGPLPNQKWSLLSVSIQAGIGIGLQAGNGGLPSTIFTQVIAGQLGKVEIFLLAGEAAENVAPNDAFPSNGGLLSTLEPAYDETLSAVLFDPAVNNTPPQTFSIVASAAFPPTQPPVILGFDPIAAQIVPPFPIPLTAGVPPILGISMKPSIITFLLGAAAGKWSGAAVLIGNATYTVNYDDGL